MNLLEPEHAFLQNELAGKAHLSNTIPACYDKKSANVNVWLTTR